MDETNTTNNFDTDDMLSTIRFGTTTESGALAQAFTIPILCATNGSSLKVIAYSVDIIVSDLYEWFYDPTGILDLPAGKRDFYHVVLHELGHAHELNHVNQIDDIMWKFDIYHPTEITPANDRKVFIDEAQSVAAVNIVDFSETISFEECDFSLNTHTPLEVVFCNISTDVGDIGVKGSSYNAYPNPFNNEINLHFGNATVGNAKIQIFDQLGRLILSKVENAREAMIIDTSSVNSGFYILNISLNGMVSSLKLVKQ